VADQPALTTPINEEWVPYRHPQSRESPPELVVPNAVPIDERIWVPLEENVWFRPLLLCASRGYWMNLLRVRKAGVLSRQRHPQPVHAYVIKEQWRYLEHDWVATKGSYAYEAPGETHTLVADPHVEEMITLFQVNGAKIDVDPEGRTLGCDDVFTRIDKRRAHYARNVLGVEYVDQFSR
jgi:quercetin dioxygenase-like cupin family protein